MAKILVVDDRPANREFLTTLLGYGGHHLLEAGDGAEALTEVRAQRPDLVIADVLMPTMDGYEFVRQLRSDPEVARTPVIFYTATYYEREARSLAEACGVSSIITKPSEPELIVATVNAALSSTPPPPRPLPGEEFDREHLKLLSDTLAEKVNELEAANLRLAALLEVGRQLALEQDPTQLVGIVCSAAREMVGSRFAAAGLWVEGEPTLQHFFISGMDTEAAAGISHPQVDQGLLARLLAEGRPLRLRDIGDDPLVARFPPFYLPTRSLLGVPISSPGRVYGAVYLTGKLGAEEFTEEDERVVATLAAQAGVAYENSRRCDQIQQHATALECEVADRKRAEEEIGRLNQGLERRVTERTAELLVVNKELEAFSYSVSHDLRAPLRHIDGFAKIVLEEYGPQLGPEPQRYLKRIADAAKHMGCLVDDLLNLSKLGRRELTRRDAELSSLLEDVLEELSWTLAKDREIEWRVEPLPAVECDPGLVKLVFTNLLSNAAKFTRSRARAVIEVGSRVIEGQRAIFVRDNGVGFNMKYAEKLFGVFQRLHRQEDFEGTGIGLATVQRIVHKHGGRVWAEAELDRGATFYFTLGAAETGGAAGAGTRGEIWQPQRQ